MKKLNILDLEIGKFRVIIVRDNNYIAYYNTNSYNKNLSHSFCFVIHNVFKRKNVTEKYAREKAAKLFNKYEKMIRRSSYINPKIIYL